MTKTELRKHYLKERKKIDTAQLNEQSSAIQTQLIDLLVAAPPAYLHVFLPILKNNEIDTWQVIEHVWANMPHTQVVTSVTDFKTKTMHNYVLEPDTVLKENNWGIQEPQDAQPVEDVWIDWVMIPLLCFDKRGYRVGYGGGFYDRFLANCAPNIKKTGVSLFSPVDRIVDIDTYDIALSHCITPSQIYTFEQSS